MVIAMMMVMMNDMMIAMVTAMMIEMMVAIVRMMLRRKADPKIGKHTP